MGSFSPYGPSQPLWARGRACDSPGSGSSALLPSARLGRPPESQIRSIRPMDHVKSEHFQPFQRPETPHVAGRLPLHLPLHLKLLLTQQPLHLGLGLRGLRRSLRDGLLRRVPRGLPVQRVQQDGVVRDREGQALRGAAECQDLLIKEQVGNGFTVALWSLEVNQPDMKRMKLNGFKMI